MTVYQFALLIATQVFYHKPHTVYCNMLGHRLTATVGFVNNCLSKADFGKCKTCQESIEL